MSAAEWARHVSRRDLADNPGLLDSEPLRVVPAYCDQVEHLLAVDTGGREHVVRRRTTVRLPGCWLLLSALGAGLVFALYSVRDPFGPGAAWVLAVGGLLFAGAAASMTFPLRRSAPPLGQLLSRLALLDLVAVIGLWRATSSGVEVTSPWWLIGSAGVAVGVGLTLAMLVVRACSTLEDRERTDAGPARWRAETDVRMDEITARTHARLEKAWSSLAAEDRERLTAERRAAFEVLHERELVDDVEAELARTPGLRMLEEQALPYA